MSSEDPSKKPKSREEEIADAQAMVRDVGRAFGRNRIFLVIALLATGGLGARAMYDTFRNFRLIDQPPHLVGIDWDAGLAVLLLGAVLIWVIVRLIRLPALEAQDRVSQQE